MAASSAAADPTRWLNFRPYKDLPPLEPGNPAVAPWYFDWIRHSARDDYWRRWSIRDRYAAVPVPGIEVKTVRRALELSARCRP